MTAELDDIVRSALDIADIESAAIFVVDPFSGGLVLAAAAGIEGPPLDALVAAVQNPMHPIARALHDTDPTFEVRPINPGGPALRSHLPLDGLGVLAVAHQRRSMREHGAPLSRWRRRPLRTLRADDWAMAPGLPIRTGAYCSAPCPLRHCEMVRTGTFDPGAASLLR